MTTTTETDHIKPDQFDAYLASIRSGQVDQAHVPALLEANPGFAAWYRRGPSDAGALLKLAFRIENAHSREQYADILWDHAETIAAALRQAASQGSAGGERSEVQTESTKRYEHVPDDARAAIEAGEHSELPPLRDSARLAQAPTISVKPMELSDNRTDYFVSISVGDREITPYVFRDEQFKAEYEAAIFRWLLLGEPKPDLMAYSEDGWPSTVPSADSSTPINLIVNAREHL